MDNATQLSLLTLRDHDKSLRVPPRCNKTPTRTAFTGLVIFACMPSLHISTKAFFSEVTCPGSLSEDKLVEMIRQCAKPHAVLSHAQRDLRFLFYTVLNKKEQRRAFLRCLAAGVRLAALFQISGAPPLWFLNVHDCGFLDASSISISRVQMAYKTQLESPPIAQRGHVLWIDANGGVFTRGDEFWSGETDFSATHSGKITFRYWPSLRRDHGSSVQLNSGCTVELSPSRFLKKHQKPPDSVIAKVLWTRKGGWPKRRCFFACLSFQ